MMGNVFAALLCDHLFSHQLQIRHPLRLAAVSLEAASPTVIKIEIPPPTSHRDRLPIMNPELILYALDKTPYCRARLAWRLNVQPLGRARKQRYLAYTN